MKLPVLLAAAALAVCLTGCSHAQTDATPSATSETAEAAATATPAAAGHDPDTGRRAREPYQ